MAKLDRLGWAAGITLSAYGRRVGIRVTDAPLLDLLLPELPPGCHENSTPQVDELYSVIGGGPGPHPGIHRLHLLYVGSYNLIRTRTLADLCATFRNDVEAYLAKAARPSLFVHAGVVGYRGGAVLLPGRTHTGKSELVAALVNAGAEYYSDEFAILDPQGRVHAYPRPPVLRRIDAPAGPSDMANSPRRRLPSLPVRLVVATAFRTGRAWQMSTMTPGETALGLLGHTIAARTRPRAALKTLTAATRSAQGWRGIRGEAEDAAPHILRALITK